MSTSIAAERRLEVGGMTCAACVARVERALRSVPGVVSASVNIATERAVAAVIEGRYATPAEATAALVAAIRRIGYEARPMDAGEPRAAAEERLRRADGHDRLRVLAGIALSLPLVAPMLTGVIGAHLALPGLVQLALATPVQFWLGARFYRAGWKALVAGAGTMDLLVAIGTTAAYGLSLWELASAAAAGRPPHLYFEASAVVITLVLLGKWLETRARRSTADAVRKLHALAPQRARLLRDEEEADVPIAAIGVGDLVVVRPGERIAIDGVVREGTTEIDESMVTGENLPVPAAVGARVLGGTLNGTGRIIVETTASAADGALARIALLVELAQSTKAPIQRLVDRVAAWFVPAVIVIAIATGCGWWVAGAGLETSLLRAVAVLVIACPCALGLATPAALVAGTGAAARAGILIRDAEALEHAARVRVVAFDKTGTLTEGRPRLANSRAFVVCAREPLVVAAALQRDSEHPLARAIAEAAAGAALAVPAAAGVSAAPGLGVSGSVDGRQYLLGTPRFLDRNGVDPRPAHRWLAAEAAAGRAVAVLADLSDTPTVWAAFSFADSARPSARAAVAALTALGIDSVLVTGDHEASAQALANEIGIGRVHANVLPAEKLQLIAELRAQFGAVAMVGDGINDAPALAAADLGIAMGSGTDVAIAASGITLVRTNPRAVVDALDIARRTRRKIRENLFFALAYNVAGVPLAALGMLSPVVAGAAMALSSVSVVTNALLLGRWRPH
jgi:P-type Cu+ transporter